VTEQSTQRARSKEREPGQKERHADTLPREPRANGAPTRERRASHRVGDDQKSGQGSQSALSKLKMLERKRDAITPGRDDST
jgi:hypothetical protein